MWNKIDQAECEKIFRDRQIGFEIVGDYTCAGNKAEIKCLECGHVWKTRPRYLLDGHGCPLCSKKIANQKQQLPSGEFALRMSSVSDKIALKSTYVSMNVKIDCYCLICGATWSARPYDLLRGRGCPQCKWETIRSKRLKSHDDYISDVAKHNPFIRVLSQYDGSKRKVEAQCLKCGYEWSVSAGELLYPRECPMCEKVIWRQSLLRDETSILNEIQENLPHIYFVDKYQGTKRKILCGCSLCGLTWHITPGALLRGQGCPDCDKVKSCGERVIRKYLDDRNVQYEEQYKPDGLVGTRGGRLSYDFYLPNTNVVIEYNGQYHDGSHPMQTDEEYYRQIEHDKRKHQFAIKNGLNLFYIWYWDAKRIFEILDAHLVINAILPCNDHTCTSNCVGYASSM